MKKYIAIAAVVIIGMCVYAAAQDSAAPKRKLTKDEMAARINGLLTRHPDVAPTIRGLEATRDESGAMRYTLNKKKISELDEDTLGKLLPAINQQVTLKNTQRIERQQRQIRSAQQQTAQVNRVPSPPPQTPPVNPQPPQRVYTPPAVPKSQR